MVDKNLTWQDVKDLYWICDDLEHELAFSEEGMQKALTEEEQYTEALRRFNEFRAAKAGKGSNVDNRTKNTQAPDKIYFDGVDTSTIPRLAINVEYIRKEALIEWAKEQAKHFSARSDELEVIDPTNPDMVFFDGKRDAFTEMIKRIESL